MYKLLIADDEKMIREGLVDYIPWEKWNIKISGTAKDGNEVLELLEGQCPDILITDINMPYLNGVELLKTIRDRKYDIEVIFISAYSEFQYAHSAIKYGAADYIIKPIEEEILEECIEKCIARLEKKRMHEPEKLDTTYIVPVLRQTLLSGGELPKGLGESISRYCGCKLQYLHCYFQSWMKGTDIHLQSAGNEECSFKIPMGEQVVTTVWFCGHEKEFDEADVFCLDEWGVEDAGKSYMHHMIRFLKKSQVSGRIKQLVRQPGKDLKETLGELLETGEEICYEEVYRCYLETEIREERIRDLQELARSIVSFIRTYTGSVDKIYTEQFEADRMECTHQLYQYDNFYDMYLYGEKLVCQIQQSLELPGSGNRIVMQAIQYIQKHYGENITLSNVAEQIEVSSSHLSRLMKKELECNFIDYLIQYRISQAKKIFVHENMKVYEVAERVGYGDVVAFSKMFRKITGYAPSKFVRMNMK